MLWALKLWLSIDTSGFALREIIRYKLIPRAIAYYTGEAAEDDEGDDEDEFDDEDEDDEEARGPRPLFGEAAASSGIERVW